MRRWTQNVGCTLLLLRQARFKATRETMRVSFRFEGRVLKERSFGRRLEDKARALWNMITIVFGFVSE